MKIWHQFGLIMVDRAKIGDSVSDFQQNAVHALNNQLMKIVAHADMLEGKLSSTKPSGYDLVWAATQIRCAAFEAADLTKALISLVVDEDSQTTTQMRI